MENCSCKECDFVNETMTLKAQSITKVHHYVPIQNHQMAISKQSLSWVSERYNHPPIATYRSDLCADLWVRAKLLAPVAEELGLFARPSVKSKRSGARIETLV